MSKKRIRVSFAMVMLLFFITACSTENTDEKDPQDASSDATSELSGSSESETDKTAITFPEAELQKLDEGENVQHLQEALNEIGYSIPIDGTFGEATTWAVTDFQFQHEDLLALGVYKQDTKIAMDEVLSTANEIEPGAGIPQDVEVSTTESGTPVLANPYDQLSLVNKSHALPADYMPEDMVIPDVKFPFTEELPKKQMRKVAADALEEMFQEAEEEGLVLFAQSGYRSYERQEILFASYVDQHGEKAANTFSARPGESEHQTGLTMDVTSADINYQLNTNFGDTDEGKWVKENAATFGFIIRYPEGKEEITEYQYEPWHLRYVGEKAANEIMSQGITFEKYLGAI
ncbi:D-alanyl-D-alanine carboxypeptidase family protein [Virgibacillus ainsalahensis]